MAGGTMNHRLPIHHLLRLYTYSLFLNAERRLIFKPTEKPYSPPRRVGAVLYARLFCFVARVPLSLSRSSDGKV